MSDKLLRISNFLSIFFTFVIVFFVRVSRPIDCPHQLDYLRPAKSSTKNNDEDNTSITSLPEFSAQDYNLIQSTVTCFSDFERHLPNSDDVPFCEDGDLHVAFYPNSVFPNGTNILPYVTLNVSVTAFTPLHRLFVQFRCVHAMDLEDKYCHDHSDQIRNWGRMIWPCRELEIIQAGNTTNFVANFPIRFSYNCFNLFGLSQYELNVTVAPKLCRSTFLVTIPSHRQLDPNIRNFFQPGDGTTVSNDWSPLIFVDLSLPDGVWLRFQPMTWMTRPNFVTITVFERDIDRKMHFLFRERIPANESGFKWENVAVGEYSVFVLVERFDCRLSCQNEARNFAGDCKACPNTSLNFTISSDKFSIAFRRSTAIFGLAKVVSISVLVALGLVIIALLLVLLYLRVWRPHQLARRPAQNVELKERPSVLILYTDDCEEHTTVTAALANLLAESANANVLLDQFALQDPSIRPSIWLLNAISEAQFILLIFSDCSKRVLNGGKLLQRRPFADLFNSAIGYVIAKINEIISARRNDILRDGKSTIQEMSFNRNKMALKNSNDEQSNFLMSTAKRAELSRFIVARFAYSPPSVIPEFFARELFGQLCLPTDLGALVGRLHGVFSFGQQMEAERNRFECSANTDELSAAIRAFEMFSRNNPNWVEERFEKEAANSTENGGDQNEGRRLNERLERLAPSSTPTSTLPTVDEQIKLSEKYGLKVLPMDLQIEEVEDGDEVRVDLRRNLSNNGNETNIFDSKNVPSQKFELIGNLEDFCPSSSSSSLLLVGDE